MLRRTRINPRNEERQEREKDRQFDPDGLGAFVLSLPCSVEGCPGQVMRCHYKTRRNGGAWREDPHTKKEIGNLWPGCDPHHREQHNGGIQTFQAKYKLDLDALTRDIGERYTSGEPVVVAMPW